MQTNDQRKEHTKKLLVLLWMLVVLFTLTTVATYTWFTISQTPRVSDLYMFINTETGLEISTDPEGEWGYQLDFREMVGVTTPLRPITWSEKDQCFYAAGYGFDGRMTGTWEPLNDNQHANKKTLDGYYIKATFYARTGQDVTVSLSPAVEIEEGISGSGTYLIGTPVWDSETIRHENGGQGAETAVRVGIRITPVDATGAPTDINSTFYIYEPNADGHIDGSTGYVPTSSIDLTQTLVPEDRLILQSASTWTEAYPVQRTVVIKDLGEFFTEPELFKLKADNMVRIDLYIWLEGQDIDCTNAIKEAQIMANIQFLAKVDDQSGLTPIE